MNVYQRIKQKIEDHKQQKHILRAQKLSALRKERLKLEGQKKVIDTQNKELAKIKAAKQAIRSNSKFNKTLRAVKEELSAIKTRRKAREVKEEFTREAKKINNLPPMFR